MPCVLYAFSHPLHWYFFPTIEKMALTSISTLDVYQFSPRSQSLPQTGKSLASPLASYNLCQATGSYHPCWSSGDLFQAFPACKRLPLLDSKSTAWDTQLFSPQQVPVFCGKAAFVCPSFPQSFYSAFLAAVTHGWP